MISDVLDEQEEYLPYSLEKLLAELNDVWKQQKAAEKALDDLEKLKQDESSLPEDERTVEEAMLEEARHTAHTAAFKVEEKAARLLKHSCLQFAQRLVDGVHAKKEQIDEQILLAAKN